MKRNFVIRLPGDSEAQVAKRTLRLRQEVEEKERRATMRLVAKSAARAILEGKRLTREQVAKGDVLVSVLTDDEIKTAVISAATTKRLLRDAKRGGK